MKAPSVSHIGRKSHPSLLRRTKERRNERTDGRTGRLLVLCLLSFLRHPRRLALGLSLDSAPLARP